MSKYYTAPDKDQGELFKKAEAEMKAVAEKHGFHIRLIDDSKGTWYFYPEVSADWEPPVSQPNAEVSRGQTTNESESE